MSSSSEPNTTKATNRGHNEGRQSRAYTSAQASAVERVRKCRVSDYYAILDIESSATESEIRKAYRKLALVMHPDKNGAPGADEAFKMVSKAFQVLSDADKKRIFDQTGSDPESRSTSAGFSGFPRQTYTNFAGANGANGMFDEDFADQIFRSFFGGGMNGMGPNVQFQGFGPFGSVGGFQFGPGGMPGMNARRAAAGAGAGADGRVPPAANDLTSNLIRLLPLLLLFVTPLLSSLFDTLSGNSSTQIPRFEFTPSPPYTEMRTTTKYNVPYYITPKDAQRLTSKTLRNMDSRAEVTYIHSLTNHCDREYEIKQQKIMDAHGWFSTDEEALREAEEMVLPHCERLKQLGLRR